MNLAALAIWIGLALANPSQSREKERTPRDDWSQESPIRHPERLSGLWETEEGHGIIGVDIKLITVVRGAPATLYGANQTLDHAAVQVYAQGGPSPTLGDGNWFRDDSEGVKWSGDHLKISAPAKPKLSFPETQIDLQFDRLTGSWAGLFHRGDINREVVLQRPHVGGERIPSPLVGTWKRSTTMHNCLHIAQDERGALVAWMDDLEVPGAMRYADGLRPPNKTVESYGTPVLVSAQNQRGILFEPDAFSAIALPTYTGGTLSPDGRYIRMHSGGNSLTKNIQHLDDWKRVRGGSCISAR